MKTLRPYLAFAFALTLLPWAARAQGVGALFITVGGGGMSLTSDYGSSSSYTPDDVGYVGRIGIQASLLSPRFQLGAEFEYSGFSQRYTGPGFWCGPNSFWRARCDDERTTLKSLNLSGRWTLTDVQSQFQPYVLFGTGWMRAPMRVPERDPQTMGPRTDLGFGLAIDPFDNAVLQLAIEPRYAFFYFPQERNRDRPSHVSVAVVTRVRIISY